MTFVAQPYDQFADDLLTALTGGIAREEHQFIGLEESYSLASPGVIPPSIKVFGQRNETFMLFEGGTDYVYDDDDEEAIVWQSDGRQPDDHSFFYVNYYLEEGRHLLTDRNPGSVTTLLAESVAREFAVLHKQMEMIYKSAFVDLASNRSLDFLSSLLDQTRRGSKASIGEILLTRGNPAPGDITIPVGTLFSTAEGQNFETTEKRTLRRGQLSIVVPIRAQIEGPNGRVDANKITIMNRPILGIDSALNEEATFFATEKETDEAFRRRIKSSLERAGKATLNAIKYGLIEEIPEITEDNIQVSELVERGLVDVTLGLESKEDADLVRRVEESIFNSKAAGVRVTHNLPTFTPSESEQRAAAQHQPITRIEALEHMNGAGPRYIAEVLDAGVLASMPEDLLKLRVDVFLRLVEMNLSASQKDRIEDDVRNQVVDYIRSLPMDADLIYNQMVGRIMQSEQISDADLLIGPHSASKKEDFKRSNLATRGRKATIDPGDVFVGLMEENVRITVIVTLEQKDPPIPQENDSDLANTDNGDLPDLIPVSVETLKGEIGDALNNVLATKTNAARAKAETNEFVTMTKTEMMSNIRDVIPSNSQFQLIDNGAVIVNAEYEETGRLLNMTEEITLEGHQVARLRDVIITVPGVLDG